MELNLEISSHLIQDIDVLPPKPSNGKCWNYDKYIRNRVLILNKLLDGVFHSNAPKYFNFGSKVGFYNLYIFYLDLEFYNKLWNFGVENSKKNLSKYRSEILLYKSSNNTHQWQSKNLTLDKDGKSIIHKKAYSTQVDNGNFNLSSTICINKIKLLKLDRYGTSYTGLGYWKRTKYNQNIDDIDNYVSDGRIYLHNQLTYINHLKNYNLYALSNSKLYGWHSIQEELTCKILSDLSLDYEREVVVYRNNYTIAYRIDFYILDLDIYLEIDGMHKFITVDGKLVLNSYHLDRERYIESKLNKSLIRIMSSDIFYYLHHKKEFLDRIKTPKYYLISAEWCNGSTNDFDSF